MEVEIVFLENMQIDNFGVKKPSEAMYSRFNIDIYVAQQILIPSMKH